MNKKVEAYREITSSLATVMRYHSIIYRCYSSWKQYSLEAKISRVGTWPELWRLSKLTPDSNKQFGDIMHESYDLQHGKDKHNTSNASNSHNGHDYSNRFIHPDDSKSVLTSSSISSVSSPQMLLHQYSKGSLHSHGHSDIDTDMDKPGHRTHHGASISSVAGIAERLKHDQRSQRRDENYDRRSHSDDEEQPVGRKLQHQFRGDQLQYQHQHQLQQLLQQEQQHKQQQRQQRQQEQYTPIDGRRRSSAGSSEQGGRSEGSSSTQRRRREDRGGRKGVTLQDLMFAPSAPGRGPGRQSPRHPSASAPAPAAGGILDFLDDAIEDDIDFDDYYDTQQQQQDDQYDEEYEDDSEFHEGDAREQDSSHGRQSQGQRQGLIQSHSEVLEGLDLDAEDQLSEALDLEADLEGSYGTHRSQLTSTGGSYSGGSLAFSGETESYSRCV